MRLLDLCCRAGGASMGYAAAGFEVEGVDIEQQKHYPFTFHLGDALTFPFDGFDAIHVSPSCKPHTRLNALHMRAYEDLIPAMRARLQQQSRPWVIENVKASVLVNPLMLYGPMFGLKVLRRRYFESNFLLFAPNSYQSEGTVKDGAYVTVVGHDFQIDQARAAMGIDWMTVRELSQAIPPPIPNG